MKKQNVLKFPDKKTEQDVFQLSFIRDTLLTFPELYLEVHIAADNQMEESLLIEMFVRSGCTKAESVLTADLVVFGGGVDVNPDLYGSIKHSSTFYDSRRDAKDIDLFNLCKENRIPMMGICRGAQFLHVMNGGKLYQHVDNHTGDHNMWDVGKKVNIGKVSSVHHQMVVSQASMTVLGQTWKAQNRWLDPAECVQGHHADIEAFYYRDTACFGVQGHPEYRNYGEFTKWTLNTLQELVNENPDIVLENNTRRLRADDPALAAIN